MIILRSLLNRIVGQPELHRKKEVFFFEKKKQKNFCPLEEEKMGATMYG